MFARINQRPNVTQIAQRFINNRHRYYYSHANIPDLLIVTMDVSIDHWIGRVVVVKFNEDENSELLCHDIPTAPQQWRNINVRKVTLMPVKQPLTGTIHDLNDLLTNKDN